MLTTEKTPMLTIEQLNVDELTNGTHQFYFQVATDALGHPQLLPLWVFKGFDPERAHLPTKKIVITAGVHGDEYNGMLTAQQLARYLASINDTQASASQAIHGCIMVIPTVNLTGIINHSRSFQSADPEYQQTNLNRVFPGNSQGDEASRYIANLWQKLLQPNADLAIDLHTQTSGCAFPLFVFADYRIDDCLIMARLCQPDMIFNDPGDAGVLETVWNEHGVPAITIEVGIGRYFDFDCVDRAVAGVVKILNHYQFLNQPVEDTPIAPIEGNEIVNVRADFGGFIVPAVNLLQAVSQGQVIATHYNSFGEQVQHYYAPIDGHILSINCEPLRAAGASVIKIMR